MRAIAFVVHPSLPAESLADLLRLAKERPGQFSYGSSGTGGPHHLAMELFKMQAGVNIQHVPYKGGAQHRASLKRAVERWPQQMKQSLDVRVGAQGTLAPNRTFVQEGGIGCSRPLSNLADGKS